MRPPYEKQRHAVLGRTLTKPVMNKIKKTEKHEYLKLLSRVFG